MLQLQPSHRAVQAPCPHHPVPGAGLRAVGGLGGGAPAAAGSGQESVQAVVSAGVVPLVAAVDERSLIDEQGALGIAISRFSWFWFLQGGGKIWKSSLSENSLAILMESMHLRNAPAHRSGEE